MQISKYDVDQLKAAVDLAKLHGAAVMVLDTSLVSGLLDALAQAETDLDYWVGEANSLQERLNSAEVELDSDDDADVPDAWSWGV